MTMDGTYEDIDKAISSAYTPKDADIDYYLQVTASYTDPEGEGKTAMGTSANAVQGLRSDNNPPKFADDQDPDMADHPDGCCKGSGREHPSRLGHRRPGCGRGRRRRHTDLHADRCTR